MVKPKDKPKQPDQYRILEESRQAAVQTVANVLDGMSKTKKLRRRFEATYDDDRERVDKDDKDGDSDFLFDMLRLNATYLNEVARLGARYRDFAYRALENMYRVANPGLKNQGADELVFTRDTSTTRFATRSFVVQNDVNPNAKTATMDVPRISTSGKTHYADVLELSPARGLKRGGTSKDESRREYTVDLTFGVPKVIDVRADLDLCNRRTFDDHIEVKLALDARRTRNRRIAVVLDGRIQKPAMPGERRGSETPKFRDP